MAGNESTDDKRSGRTVTIKRTITIHRSAAELYGFWRDLRNLKDLLPDAVSVTQQSKDRSHWSVRVPGGRKVEWDTEIVDDRPGRVIAWESGTDADVANSGSVKFDPQKGGRDGTKVGVEIRYRPPGGLLGAALGKVVRSRAADEMTRGLRRVKERLESRPQTAER